MARATRAEWEQRIARWERSGLSKEDFGQREGLAPEKLNWWRWELRRKSATKAIARRPAFVEVNAIEQLGPSGERVEVVLGNGRIVRVPATFDDAVLGRVLAIAERR